MAAGEPPILAAEELALEGEAATGTPPATAGIPTIMLTARGYNLEPSDTEQNGIDCMLSKPFSPRQLLATVSEMLAKAAA